MLRLEHVGIAVRDLEASRRVFDALLGLEPYKTETVEAEGVRTHFLDAGSAKLELLEALGDGSPIAGFLERRGPGIHHLAFEVADLKAAHDRLRTAGFRLLGDPKNGADGKRIFFVHPKDAEGVLIELCETAHAPEGESATARGVLRLGPSVPMHLQAALSRWFRLTDQGSGGPLLLWRSAPAAGVEEPLVHDAFPAGKFVAIDPTGTAPVSTSGLIIRTDPSSSDPADVRLPGPILWSLPDPWGLLARIAAAHFGAGD